MGRIAKYPFLHLQPGQTIKVRTDDSSQTLAAAAWRAGRQASDLLGEPVRFSVRRADEQHYFLTRWRPGYDGRAPIVGGAEPECTPLLSEEELQAQRDNAYREKVRRQLREKAIREEIEAELAAEFEEKKFELEKQRQLRRARAEAEIATELAKIRAEAKRKADAVEFALEQEKNKRQLAAYVEAERESEQALGADGLPEADPDLYAELTEFKKVLKAEGIGPEQPAK